MTNERQQRAARAEQMRKEREKADRRQRNYITAGIIVVVLALVAIGGYAVKSTSDSRAKETDVVVPKGATADHGVNFTPEDAGGKAAPDVVPVVIYEDFGCPGCLAFERSNGQFVEAAVKKGEITVEYRMVNFLDRTSPNKYSSRAGSAGLCAYDSGGGEAFKKVANIFWANQPTEGALCSLAERVDQGLAHRQGHRHPHDPDQGQDHLRSEQHDPADRRSAEGHRRRQEVLTHRRPRANPPAAAATHTTTTPSPLAAAASGRRSSRSPAVSRLAVLNVV